MHTIAIIQARMGATRLPGKMMKDLGGMPAIAQVLQQVKRAKTLDEVWLATTTNSSDDVLAEWAGANGIPYYRGSEQDVLDRYYQTAKVAKADRVVRITGDCPITDAAVIDRVVSAFDPARHDYVSNVHPPTYPDGLDTEVFSYVALEKAWKEAQLSSEREHVTPYIWKHPELFRMENIANAVDLSAHRWTLDTPEDLVFLRLVVAECERRGSVYDMETVLAIIAEHPEWKEINGMFERNEGYQKSIANDQSLV